MGGGGPRRPGWLRSLGRTVLLIAGDSELAVALRDRADRAYVTVCDVRPAEATVPWRPWPWMVVGAVSELPDAVVDRLASRPLVLFWLGSQPPRLPAHVRGFHRFAELAGAVEAALRANVGGMRLAPGDGLTMPGAEHAVDPALEVLVASHPHPVFAPAQRFGRVDASLGSHRVPLRLAHSGGGARLASTGDR